MIYVTVFNYEGKRQEWSESETLRIWNDSPLFKKQLDLNGMIGVNFGKESEMVFIRQDDRYKKNLAAYLKYLMAQPPRILPNETIEDLLSRRSWIHPAETPKFKKP